MKKLFLIIYGSFVLASGLTAQTCVSYVDTTTKHIKCADSAQLASSFYKKTVLTQTLMQTYFVSLFFVNADTGFIAGYELTSGGWILKTTNGGNSWFDVSGGTIPVLFSVYFTNSTTGYVAGANGTILKSIDKGNNWIPQTSGTSQGIKSIYFIDADTGYAASTGGVILKTKNAGNSWTSLTTGTIQNLNSIYFTDVTTGYALGDAGTIIKTINSGNTWTPLNTGVISNLKSVFFTTANVGYAVGGTGTILKTTDAGNTWNQLAIGTNGNFSSVYFTNASNGYVVANSGNIYKTTNSGRNWSQFYNGGGSSLLYAIAFTNPSTCFAIGGIYGDIIKLSEINNATFNWQPSTGLNNPNIASPLASITSSTNYHVTITPNISTGCSASSDSVKAKNIPFIAPELCIVSIRNNKNLLIWDKPLELGIDSFNIWRETNITGIYAKIGTTAYSDSSLFVDTTSYPYMQSNKYKLSIKDICNTESDKSFIPHKTMHLTINQGIGTVWNLIWEPYEGFTVSTYNIYRGVDPNSLALIGTTSGSNTQYTDNNAPSGIIYYQIQVVSPNSCYPSKSYNISVSNIATNNTIGIDGIDLINNIRIYPNPVKDNLEIQTILQIDYVVVTDITGRQLLLTTKKNIDCTSFKAGIYLIKIKTDNGTIVKKFVKK